MCFTRHGRVPGTQHRTHGNKRTKLQGRGKMGERGREWTPAAWHRADAQTCASFHSAVVGLGPPPATSACHLPCWPPVHGITSLKLRRTSPPPAAWTRRHVDCLDRQSGLFCHPPHHKAGGRRLAPELRESRRKDETCPSPLATPTPGGTRPAGPTSSRRLHDSSINIHGGTSITVKRHCQLSKAASVLIGSPPPARCLLVPALPSPGQDVFAKPRQKGSNQIFST